MARFNRGRVTKKSISDSMVRKTIELYRDMWRLYQPVNMILDLQYDKVTPTPEFRILKDYMYIQDTTSDYKIPSKTIILDGDKIATKGKGEIMLGDDDLFIKCTSEHMCDVSGLQFLGSSKEGYVISVIVVFPSMLEDMYGYDLRSVVSHEIAHSIQECMVVYNYVNLAGLQDIIDYYSYKTSKMTACEFVSYHFTFKNKHMYKHLNDPKSFKSTAIELRCSARKIINTFKRENPNCLDGIVQQSHKYTFEKYFRLTARC